jgi:hypothetical protein
LLLLLLGAVPPGAAGDDPFGADGGFHQPLTIVAREQTLEDFLNDLRQAHGLPVRADASTRDERVTVYCRERPAGTILAAVARHLDFTWSRRRAGMGEEYVLTQTRDERARQEALRAAVVAAGLANLRDQVHELLVEARRTPEERRAIQLAALSRQLELQTNAETRQQTEEQIRSVTQGEDRGQPDGERLALAAALLSLQPVDWERLWRGERLRFAHPGRIGRRRFSEHQAAAMVRPVAESIGPREDDADRGLDHPSFVGVRRLAAELRLNEREERPSLQLRGRFVARTHGADLRHTLYDELSGFTRVFFEPGDNTLDPEDPELRQPVNIPPPAARPEGDPRPAWLADLLASLHRAVPYTLIGDAYAEEFGRPAPSPGPQRFDSCLRAACEPRRVEVRRDGDTLSFRHCDWAWLRAREAPERITRAWEPELQREGGLRLRGLAEAAARLSDAQIGTMLAWWEHRQLLSRGGRELVEFNFDNCFQDNRTALRVLATLLPAEWSRLMRPGSRPLPLMRATQRALIVPWFEWPFDGQHPGSTDFSQDPALPSPIARFDADLEEE